MYEPCPDILADPEGYYLWREMNACTECDGIGEDDPGDGPDGTWVCPHCEGTGIEPGDKGGNDE